MKFEKIKKYKRELGFIAFGLFGIMGLVTGLIYSDDFTQFKSVSGEAIGVAEQKILECFESNKTNCLNSIETIKYGEVIWQNKNANSAVDGVKTCYDNNPVFCEKYGGYYDFEEAKAVCENMKMHLPTLYDFQYLYAVFGNQDRFIFDMNMFPAGAIVWGETSAWEGEVARYWTSFDDEPAYYGFTVGKEPVSGLLKDGLEKSKLSVRCIKYDWDT